MVTGIFVVLLMGVLSEIVALILSKLVITFIVMAVGGSIGGISVISVVCVIFVGIFGAVFGYILFNAMRIRIKVARGLVMGIVSYVFGTARCVELDY